MSDAVKSKRKIANALVDPRAQLRLLLPCAAPLALQLLFAITLNVSIRSDLSGLTDIDNPSVLARMNTLTLDLNLITALGLVITGLVTFVLGLRSSHRLFGPTVAIRRQLAAMVEGRTGERLRLRKHDEFGEIAAQINALAEALEKRSVLERSETD